MTKHIIHVHRDVKHIYDSKGGEPILSLPGDTTLVYSDGTQETFTPAQESELNARHAIYAPVLYNPKLDPLYLGDDL